LCVWGFAPNTQSAKNPAPKIEVSPGFEPGVELLQSSALPLGYDTRFLHLSAGSAGRQVKISKKKTGRQGLWRETARVSVWYQVFE